MNRTCQLCQGEMGWWNQLYPTSNSTTCAIESENFCWTIPAQCY